jgi:hypothetical protein
VCLGFWRLVDTQVIEISRSRVCVCPKKGLAVSKSGITVTHGDQHIAALAAHLAARRAAKADAPAPATAKP